MPRKLSKVRNPYDFVHGLPRMSWAPDNLFNLYRRTYGLEQRESEFTKSSRTLFQQRWASKTLARGYHGDWVQEKRLKHHFLPPYLPHPSAASIPRNREQNREKLSTGKYHGRRNGDEQPIPLTSLMWIELERRLDVLVFRANFAPSIYAARHLVIHGKVSVNGVRECNPNVKLEPGALFSVEPTAIRMLHVPADVEKAHYAARAPAVVKALAEQHEERKAKEETEDAEETSAEPSEELEVDDVPVQPPAALAAINARYERPHQARLDHLGRKQTFVKTDSHGKPVLDPDGNTIEGVRRGVSRKALAATEAPLAFVLPDYAAPHIFVPAYLEVSYEACSAVFVRLPSAKPGVSEIPSPYDADGEVMRFTLEWYAQNNKRLYKTPRTPGPYRREFERTGLHGHGGALVAEHLAKQRKPGETLADRAKRLQTRQREVMAQARQHALTKLPPHLLADPHPSEARQ